LIRIAMSPRASSNRPNATLGQSLLWLNEEEANLLAALRRHGDSNSEAVIRPRLLVCTTMEKNTRKAAPSSKRLNNPEYRRSRAEESRTIAERMTDGNARASMLKVVGQYEEMTRKAELSRIAKEPKISS
jgi:hypothetical protein